MRGRLRNSVYRHFLNQKTDFSQIVSFCTCKTNFQTAKKARLTRMTTAWKRFFQRHRSTTTCCLAPGVDVATANPDKDPEKEKHRSITACCLAPGVDVAIANPDKDPEKEKHRSTTACCLAPGVDVAIANPDKDPEKEKQSRMLCLPGTNVKCCHRQSRTGSRKPKKKHWAPTSPNTPAPCVVFTDSLPRGRNDDKICKISSTAPGNF